MLNILLSLWSHTLESLDSALIADPFFSPAIPSTAWPALALQSLPTHLYAKLRSPPILPSAYDHTTSPTSIGDNYLSSSFSVVWSHDIFVCFMLQHVSYFIFHASTPFLLSCSMSLLLLISYHFTSLLRVIPFIFVSYCATQFRIQAHPTILPSH